MIEAPLLSVDEPLPTSEALHALSQPFFYLNKGRQCFVFESQDGKYVLKFFNNKYLQMPWYQFLTGDQETSKRMLRRLFFETSYEIAYREFGEEIVYLHRGLTDFLPHVLVADKVKEDHSLDLNQLPFVLQRKGTPLHSWLDSVYESQGLQGLYTQIDQYLLLVQERIDRNIADGDHDVIHNWGVVDGHIFHLDPGRLYYDDFSTQGRVFEEWASATRNLHRWLKKRYLPAADYLETKIKESQHVSNSI